MDIFGKKSKIRIEALEEHATRLQEQYDAAISNHMREKYTHEVEMTALCKEHENLKVEYEILKNEVEALRKEARSEEAYVKLTFATDNYEVVTPHIAITEESFEKLFSIRAIDDTQANNQQAIRLALLNLAREALEQICEDFMGDLT